MLNSHPTMNNTKHFTRRSRLSQLTTLPEALLHVSVSTFFFFPVTQHIINLSKSSYIYTQLLRTRVLIVATLFRVVVLNATCQKLEQ